MLVSKPDQPNNKGMDNEFSTSCLKDHFLIAMPELSGGFFAHSLTYICEHSEHGAMGIVINQPLNLELDEILDQLQIQHANSTRKKPVMAGGPVQIDRGFILHKAGQGCWSSTLSITDQISLTTSQDILTSIAQEEGPEDNLVALGYAGWNAGQLEQELAANAWLTLPADSDIIFKLPIEKRLDAAAEKLGIDLHLIAPGSGHA